jgi:WD40 repeat protein
VSQLSGHHDPVCTLVFTPAGDRLISGGEDGTARVWDLKTKRVLHTFSGHFRSPSALAASPDGKILATGEGQLAFSVDGIDERLLRLWSLEDGTPRHAPPPVGGPPGWHPRAGV